MYDIIHRTRFSFLWTVDISDPDATHRHILSTIQVKEIMILLYTTTMSYVKGSFVILLPLGFISKFYLMHRREKDNPGVYYP